MVRRPGGLAATALLLALAVAWPARAARSEADLLDIRNFGQKSIDEVKAKLVGMGLHLKDSPPGFDPSAVVNDFEDDDASFAEDEQL